VRGGQAGAIRADADGLADAEFFPQGLDPTVVSPGAIWGSVGV
jgi:hypothetical protein